MKVYKTTEDQRRKALEWYHNNKERAAAKAKNWRLNNLSYVRTKQREDKRKRKLEAIEYLGGKCNDCKNTHHPAVYEFHHLNTNGKDKDPSKLLQLRWERITNELNKCVLLCANCHRLRHHTWNEEKDNE